MPDSSRSSRGDGVKVVAHAGVRKSVWLVTAAFALLALSLPLLYFAAGPRRTLPAPEEPEPSSRVAAAPTDEPDAPQPEIEKRRAKPVALQRESATEAEKPTDPPAREDAPFSFGPAGEKTGMALFPPHGTKPIKIGIVVPEDFEVPEGYLRHYQSNDDGELLPAILLFHPDYQWVDEAGEVVELPADGVVPADMAPPGLAIEMLEMPEKHGGTP